MFATVFILLLVFGLSYAIISEHRDITMQIPLRINTTQIGSEAELLELIKKEKEHKLVAEYYTFKGYSFILIGYFVPENIYPFYIVPSDQFLQERATNILLNNTLKHINLNAKQIRLALKNGPRVVMIPN